MINAAYYEAQVERIKASRDCADLERVAVQTLAAVNGTVTSLTTQISQIAGLIVAPTDLSEVLTWAGAASAMFAAISTQAAADLAATTAALATLAAAINAQKQNLTCSF